jgi:hypothetical protein
LVQFDLDAQEHLKSSDNFFGDLLEALARLVFLPGQELVDEAAADVEAESLEFFVGGGDVVLAVLDYLPDDAAVGQRH